MKAGEVSVAPKEKISTEVLSGSVEGVLSKLENVELSHSIRIFCQPHSVFSFFVWVVLILAKWFKILCRTICGQKYQRKFQQTSHEQKMSILLIKVNFTH